MKWRLEYYRLTGNGNVIHAKLFVKRCGVWDVVAVGAMYPPEWDAFVALMGPETEVVNDVPAHASEGQAI